MVSITLACIARNMVGTNLDISSDDKDFAVVDE